jgi:hypothetical protein
MKKEHILSELTKVLGGPRPRRGLFTEHRFHAGDRAEGNPLPDNQTTGRRRRC